MKILNINFSNKVEWTEEVVLSMLKKYSKLEDKELIKLIKASKLVKYELQKDTKQSYKRKGKRP